MEKQTKIGMSGLNWFLSILGILIFLSFLVLPPVFRNFLEEEDSTPSPSPSSTSVPSQPVSMITTCKRTDVSGEEEYILSSTDDVLEMLAQTKTIYHEVVTEEVVTACNQNVEMYQNIPGFYYSCLIDGNNEVVEARVQLSEYNFSEIPISYPLNDSATALKSMLITDGFQCDTRNQ